MTLLVIFAGFLALGIGIAVVFANPRRLTNQACGVSALIASAQLLFVFSAIRAGMIYPHHDATSSVPMLRIAAAISVFLPWMIWILKESLVFSNTANVRIIARSAPWFCLAVILAILCFTNSFIPSDSPLGNVRRGPYFTVVNIALVVAYLVLTAQGTLQMRAQTGIRRIEMQFIVLSSTIGACLSVAFAFLGRFWDFVILRQISPFPIICACAVAAWAITYYRIFDVRQVFLSLAQRMGVALLLGAGIFSVWYYLADIVSPLVSLVLGIAIFSGLSFGLDRYTKERLGLGGEGILAAIRSTVIDLARTEPDPEKLVHQFETYLSQECRTPRVELLFDCGETYTSDGLKFDKHRLGRWALCENGWATPESLLRRRPTPQRDDLAKFLVQHGLGLLVAAPRGSSAPTLLIALRIKANEWPFTYPEVERLQNVAELMDNILTRSRLNAQAAMRAKMEHLAMMSRGLAHDLNNMITPISSFLVYTENRYPEPGPEHEVHAAAKRSVRIMGEYVRDALFFSDRLTPRVEEIDLNGLFREVCSLTTGRAAARHVRVESDMDFPGAVVGDAVLLQRMLVNLVGNAIDASSEGGRVTLAAASGRNSCVCLRVIDEGCGIATADVNRIFDPYFTTKKFGDDVRGFGLGLTICQKIVDLHGGRISIHSEVGRGTTVSIDLPVTQNIQLLESQS